MIKICCRFFFTFSMKHRNYEDRPIIQISILERKKSKMTKANGACKKLAGFLLKKAGLLKFVEYIYFVLNSSFISIGIHMYLSSNIHRVEKYTLFQTPQRSVLACNRITIVDLQVGWILFIRQMHKYYRWCHSKMFLAPLERVDLIKNANGSYTLMSVWSIYYLSYRQIKNILASN